jgi:hypothetical protein
MFHLPSASNVDYRAKPLNEEKSVVVAFFFLFFLLVKRLRNEAKKTRDKLSYGPCLRLTFYSK